MFVSKPIRRWLYILLLAMLTWSGPTRAQTVSHEYPLKAVFLLNFAQFTDWPTNALAGANDPFVIGILGNDPFGALLDETVRADNKDGHKFVIRRFQRTEEVGNCQMLFICQSEARRLDDILKALKGHPILTVSEIDDSAYRGVTVRFVTENNKIHLRVNTDSLKEANLTMSSKLLRLAELVHTRK